MNHYLYEIKNKINQKIYVGVRSCKCDISNDVYMGSGKNIKLAIKNPAARNIIVNDIRFGTGRECASHFKISPATVIYRIKSNKWEGWTYE